MPATITTFRNVRAKINRQSDGTLLAGWVTHLCREEARLRLWNFVPLVPGERMVCECFGQGTVARYTGRLIGQAGQDIALVLIGSISYAPSHETPRIYTAGLTGKLTGLDGEADVSVLDVSPTSLGVLVNVGFPTPGELDLELPTEMGPIAAKVSIANIRPEPDSPEYFRMGLHLVEMARLDRARWGRLVAESAEA